MALGERGLGRDAGAEAGFLPLRLDHLAYGSIADRSDIDGYSIILQPGRYDLYAAGTTWSGNVELLAGRVEIRDAAGSLVVGFGFGNLSGLEFFDIRQAGAYMVSVSGVGRDFGDYVLSFDHSGFDDDHDGWFGDDLRRGRTLTADLEFRSDIDAFSLPAAPDQRLIVAVGSADVRDLWLHCEDYEGPAAVRWLPGCRAFVYDSDSHVDPDVLVTSRSGRWTGSYQILTERAATDHLPVQMGGIGRDVLAARAASELYGWEDRDRLTG
mgnify:CR=1 FL=1